MPEVTSARTAPPNPRQPHRHRLIVGTDHVPASVSPDRLSPTKREIGSVDARHLMGGREHQTVRSRFRQGLMQSLRHREIRLPESTPAGRHHKPGWISEDCRRFRLQRQMELTHYTSVPEL